MQLVFLGQLTMVETAKLTERLARYVMLKLVFIGAVTTPTMAELVMWFTWCAPAAGRRVACDGGAERELTLACQRREAVRRSSSDGPLPCSRQSCVYVVQEYTTFCLHNTR